MAMHAKSIIDVGLKEPDHAQKGSPAEDNESTALLLSEPFLFPPKSSDGSHYVRHFNTMGLPQLDSKGVIILLCTINLWNYIDRGIIPGAPQQFDNFITQTLGVAVTQQSFYLGLLASAFIASYSVCSMIFGYLSLTIRPFRMIAFGMTVWIIAVVICGIAQKVESYHLLIFGRLLSGVGEASFQCNATPFINTHAPKKSRALYMGVYLASITVGTAVGYIYGAAFASSSIGWAGAYYCEAVVMAVLVSCCLFCVPRDLDSIPKEDEKTYQPLLTPKQSLEGDLSPPDVIPTEILSEDQPKKLSFFAAWWEIFSDPVFTLVVLGHAAYTFSLAALSVFSPVIFIGLGLFETETQVSMIFGGLIVITGTLGTPIGGIVVDRLTKKDSISSAKRCYIAVVALFVMIVAGESLAVLMMAFTSIKYLFLGILMACFFFLCALSPAETIAVLELFPASRRSMSIAANMLVIHVFGDVPSPIILGWLKDTWAPRCGTVVIDDEAKLNPECHKDRSGLKNVLFFAVLWMLWSVLMWGAAVLTLKRRQRLPRRASRV